MTKSTDKPRPPLGITLTDVAPAQLAKLRALERYDISFVTDRLVREKGSRSISAASAVLEFKRYMSLATLGYHGLEVPSQQVDDVWHAFLLFTREYDTFCRKTIGFFVHHVPAVSHRKPADGTRVARVYRRVFGCDLSTVGHCQTCTTCRASSNAVAHS